MEILSTKNFLKNINFQNYSIEDFRKLSNATSNVFIPDSQTLDMNFQRGILLYALIGFEKPNKILEFGTGGGFSTLCMAKALHDFKIDGKIYTIDRIAHNEKTERLIQLPDSTKPIKTKISNQEVWNYVCPLDIIKKITPIQGYSGTVMDNIEFKNIDFCYIDGVHTYDGTKHDFFSFLKNASDSFSVLFDDYIDREFYGVKAFVDQELEPNFDIKLIKLDNDNLEDENQDIQKMIYFEYDSKKSPFSDLDEKSIDTFLQKYRSEDKSTRERRYNLEKKLPFLKNIKFKFWR
tara:strand:+ start:955 stop:1830 length:876 start_codon:yes stop_codon:yes gene_type:complete